MYRRITEICIDAVATLYEKSVEEGLIQVQETRKEFVGEYTLVVFPLLRYSGKSPEITANELGNYLQENSDLVSGFNVVKGFLNLSLAKKLFLETVSGFSSEMSDDFSDNNKSRETILVEYSSPNTNKPLHLGHIRNNLLGFSISRILAANGKKVIKTNIVNDRGIHICKSMLAWKYFGNNETPQSTGVKGDHLVGRYYVRFDKEYKKQQSDLINKGFSPEEASEKSQLLVDAREMLRKWEAGDSDTVALWRMMNGWVYKGFDETYKALGVDFDKVYYESETFKLGKSIVVEAVEKGLLEKRQDGSVWADFSSEGLDSKLLLRSDGTAVYMTQDLGTAVERYQDYRFDKQYYVVGNEQNYHFQILKLVLNKIGYKWSEGINHYSYGMVELPEGKMKSREGTIVDADDLISGMVDTARETSEELGKLEDFSMEEKEEIFRKVGLAALKYFILKVDPKKNMLFNPVESIDFNGNTGPFIQYTNARINSVLRKSEGVPDEVDMDVTLNDKEQSLTIILAKFPSIVREAAETLSPAVIANYCYDLARDFNQFYHDYSILNEENINVRGLRLILSKRTGEVLEKGMWLLGIEMPERM